MEDIRLSSPPWVDDHPTIAHVGGGPKRGARHESAIQSVHASLTSPHRDAGVFRMVRLHMLCTALFAASAAMAADAPEIQRPLATPQAMGVTHTQRTIPEACARLEGRFTGDAATPYTLAVVRTSARCQSRARLVEAATAKPSAAGGWILNDVIRVPAAACTTRQAVVRIWRKPAGGAAPKMDAQGRVRVYLKEGLDAAGAGTLGAIPQYAVAMAVEGKTCG